MCLGGAAWFLQVGMCLGGADWFLQVGMCLGGADWFLRDGMCLGGAAWFLQVGMCLGGVAVTAVAVPPPDGSSDPGIWFITPPTVGSPTPIRCVAAKASPITFIILPHGSLHWIVVHLFAGSA